MFAIFTPCQGQEHRTTVDGRLCAAVFVHDRVAFSVQRCRWTCHCARMLCFMAPRLRVAGMRRGHSNFVFLFGARMPSRKCMHAVWCEVPSPDGAVGREWCYVEVAPFGSLHVRRMVAHSPCCCLALVVLSVCFIVSTCVTVAFLLLRLCASVVAWVVRMMLVARVQRIGFVGWGGVTRPPVVARQPLRKRRCRVIARRGLITGRCGCELRTHMLKRAMNLLKW